MGKLTRLQITAVMMTKKFKFAHIADCHVGSWREPVMRDLNIQAFSEAIKKIIDLKLDFVLIAGDLFNTAVPSIDALKSVTEQLKLLHDNNIPVYGIAGSHDYSAAGKSMLEVLEKAHLFKNVMKGEVSDEGKLNLFFTNHEDIKITGIVGKRGTLEKKYYEVLDYESLKVEGPKIFLFHSAISEYKPKDLADMESVPVSFLPKGFDYYAGGHVHYRYEQEEPNFGKIVYPGPLFPNSFKELQDLKHGSFVIATYENEKITTESIPLELKTKFLEINADGLTPIQVNEKLKIDDVNGAIVLLRIYGELDGKTIDIKFNEVNDYLYSKGAICVLRNTSKLNVPKFEEIVTDLRGVSDIESEIIKEHISQSDLKGKDLNNINQEEIISKMRQILHTTKKEGETNSDFEERILKEFELVL